MQVKHHLQIKRFLKKTKLMVQGCIFHDQADIKTEIDTGWDTSLPDRRRCHSSSKLNYTFPIIVSLLNFRINFLIPLQNKFINTNIINFSILF